MYIQRFSEEHHLPYFTPQNWGELRMNVLWFKIRQVHFTSSFHRSSASFFPSISIIRFGWFREGQVLKGQESRLCRRQDKNKNWGYKPGSPSGVSDQDVGKFTDNNNNCCAK
jgi:hypothetical protein